MAQEGWDVRERVLTDDETPAKSYSTQVKILIEDMRSALHSTQNCRISLRETRWDVMLCVRVSLGRRKGLGEAQSRGVEPKLN